VSICDSEPVLKERYDLRPGCGRLGSSASLCKIRDPVAPNSLCWV
jgi:hypothetical protein